MKENIGQTQLVVFDLYYPYVIVTYTTGMPQLKIT